MRESFALHDATDRANTLSVESRKRQRYLIQIESKGSPLTLDTARALLEPAGVTLDPSYGPFCVNREKGLSVVRGEATARARDKAERTPGVAFFADAPVHPTKR